MAKKKEESKKVKDVDDLYVSANSILDKKMQTISISPALDLLTGGFKEGGFGIFAGPPKIGKTTTALQIAANAQDPKYTCEINQAGNPRTVYFFNIEGRLSDRDITGIHNLKEDQFKVVQSEPGNILTAEDYIERGETLINEKPGDVFIFDSFSQLCTKGRREADLRDRYRDDTALLLAAFCKRICNIIPVNRSLVMGITHLMANQGHGHSETKEGGGFKIQYANTLKLRATYKEPLLSGEEQVGQYVHWKCENSSIHGSGNQGVSTIRYGYGLDDALELVTLCTDFGIVIKGGAWYSIGDKKVQGIEAARNLVAEDRGLYDELWARLIDMTGTKSN